jgi:hypothetical protein
MTTLKALSGRLEELTGHSTYLGTEMYSLTGLRRYVFTDGAELDYKSAHDRLRAEVKAALGTASTGRSDR